MQDSFQSDALEALKLRLVRSKEDVKQLTEDELVLIDDFAPNFVYPIFGQEETIFGYTGLDINLYFASGSLSQYLAVEYLRKFVETTTVTADDPEKVLFEFIPPSYSKVPLEFHKIVEADAISFTPIGERIGGYARSKPSSKGKGKGKASSGKILPERPWTTLGSDNNREDDEVIYVAYQSNWETPGFKEYHRKMQIFVLLYIEGAQYIDEEDGRWEFITLFERRKRGASFVYHFVGFVSFYSFFCWPDTKRLRLAQFVVLPPYQNCGHGSALYNLSYQHIMNRPEISELTVEDPSENFDDMRDKADLYTLISGGDLEAVSAPVDRATTEKIRRKYKLADRQFYRLLEMILLLDLDYSETAKVTAFRLMVKRRLYLFNKDGMADVSAAERKEGLQKTYDGLVADYRRLTEKFDQ